MPKNVQKIIPHLWYDTEAREAATFYSSIFPESKVDKVTVLHDTPSGDSDIVPFELWGHKFMAISAGPLFKFNTSISFIVNFDPLFFGKGEKAELDARKKLDHVWEKLSKGGKTLMALDKYPFSERYGWVEDKYGLSWQLMLTDPKGEPRPSIIPSLMFAGKNAGKAKAAMDFYLSVFRNSKPGMMVPYPAGQEPNKEGTVMFADFTIEKEWLALMDSAVAEDAPFNEAISLMVSCKDQAEIDYYWDKLSAVPESEQCGWVKDKFGVSWQVHAADLDEMFKEGTPEQIERLTQTFMPMKKLDLAALKLAYEEALTT